MLFTFDAGQELTEHRASRAAILHVIEGNATITLGGTAHVVAPGGWVYMPRDLVHAVRANTKLALLLTLLGSAREKVV
ncbi:MAG: cupin domain-containing protein, partial [Dongiaceae bacterium]